MNQNHLHTGIDFARAVAEHFNLPSATDADIEMITGAKQTLGVKVKLMLTADDLAAIADRMAGRTQPSLVDTNLAEFLRDTPAAPALQSIKIREGAALVVTTANFLNPDQRDKLRTNIRAELGSNVRILIMDRGTSLAVLTGLTAAGDGVTRD